MRHSVYLYLVLFPRYFITYFPNLKGSHTQMISTDTVWGNLLRVSYYSPLLICKPSLNCLRSPIPKIWRDTNLKKTVGHVPLTTPIWE